MAALSAKSIATIKATAGAVAPHATTITKNFYGRLFRKHPELFAFFNKSNQHAGRQPAALANAVVAYASNIDNLGVLGPAVEMMAVKHCGLQVLPAHYPIVHDNLMESVAEVLGDAVTPEVAEGWSEAVMHLAGILIDAEEGLYAAAENRTGGWRGWRQFEVAAREDHVGGGVGTDAPGSISTFTFKPTDGYAGGFDFIPGDYLTVNLGRKDSDGDHIAPRHYTLTSAPGADHLSCTVKRMNGGVVSGLMHKDLKEGDKVNISPPQGAFHMPETTNDIILLSAGIGATPMQAFLGSNNGARVKKTVHVDRKASENPFHNKWLASGIDYTIVESGSAPQADMGAVLDAMSDNDLAVSTVLLCGPNEFMIDAAAMLRKAGASKVQYEVMGPRITL